MTVEQQILKAFDTFSSIHPVKLVSAMQRVGVAESEAIEATQHLMEQGRITLNADGLLVRVEGKGE